MSLLIQYLLAAVALHTSSAHLHLLRSSPAANDTVAAAPAALKFWFSERPELAITSVKLMGADGAMVKLAPLAVDSGALVAPVKGPIAAGTYTVTWRTTAMDGHPANGKFDFVVSH